MDAASILGAAPAVYCRVYRAWGANGAILPSNVLGLHWAEQSSIVEVLDTLSETGQELDVSALWLVGRVAPMLWWPESASIVLAFLQGQRAGPSGASSHGRKSGSEN